MTIAATAEPRQSDEDIFARAIAEGILTPDGYLPRERYWEMSERKLTPDESWVFDRPHPRIRAIMMQVREVDKAYFKENREAYYRIRPYVYDEQWPELPLTDCESVAIVCLKNHPGEFGPDRRVYPLSGAHRKWWPQHDPYTIADQESVAITVNRSIYTPGQLSRSLLYCIGFDRSSSDCSSFDRSSAQSGNGVLLSTVTPEKTRWLWQGRIPYGKLTVLDGDPGLGKSTVTMDLAARLSAGLSLPDGTSTDAAGVVLLTAEDGLADTVVPRLIAVGADLDKILAFTIKEDYGDRLPSLPDDIAELRDAIERMSAGLVIIDPLMAFLGGNVNSFKDQDIRRALAPMAMVAEEIGAAIVIVRHLNKAATGSPLYRGGGSIGIIGAARSGLLVAADPDDSERRVLAPTKSNLGPLAPSLSFSLHEAPNGVAAVRWDGPSTYTAAALLALSGTEEDRSALEEAKAYLREVLAEGGQWVKMLLIEARQQGISDRTLKRAKAELGIKSYRVGAGAEGGWKWSTPGRD